MTVPGWGFKITVWSDWVRTPWSLQQFPKMRASFIWWIFVKYLPLTCLKLHWTIAVPLDRNKGTARSPEVYDLTSAGQDDKETPEGQTDTRKQALRKATEHGGVESVHYWHTEKWNATQLLKKNRSISLVAVHAFRALYVKWMKPGTERLVQRPHRSRKS